MMNIKYPKRWSVMRKTGKTVASFNTRDQARSRKRQITGAKIFDNVNLVTVR